MKTVSKLSGSLFGRRQKGLHRDPGFPEISGQGYLQTLVEIVTARQANWYLEIGSRSGTSLSKIGCNFIAIDPEFQIRNPVFQRAQKMHFFQMTSDEFFADDFLATTGITPDVAFIDGMHHFEFALRDFLNCEATMGPDGVIVLHDVCPSTAAMASRDLTELNAKRAWTGDVWKVVAALMDHRPDLEIHVLDAAKTGLCVIHGLNPDSRILRDNLPEIIAQYIDVDIGSVGPAWYYDRIAIQPSHGFAARLAVSPKPD